MGSYAGAATPEGSKTIDESREPPAVLEKVVIDKIWSAVPVGFILLTHGDTQYVAYYDSDRNMAVGQRTLTEKSFTKTVLPSNQGWDSHNYITMAVDNGGFIHLSGNMHARPLVYFRSGKPGDSNTLKQIKSMTGSNEKRCTYPKFMKGPKGDLIFHYRDGGSGNGVEIYNTYDLKTKTWRRMMDTPLISGIGRSNAYQRGPTLGPDGWYHLIWMWRDTPDVATNHDLSYARSRDLLNWETVAGKPLKLPITPENNGTIIDPVPVKGGLHNSNHHFGFDSKGRVVVTYYKHDDTGNTQAYAARFDDGAWRIRTVSDWDGRHIFKGGGSGPSTFGTSLGLGKIRQYAEGRLAIPFSHWKAGRGLLVIDEETFELIRVAQQPKKVPASLMKTTSDFPGMGVRWRDDTGTPPDPDSRYVLRWETLGRNRDRPRTPPLPESGELVLYKLGYTK